MEHIIDSSNVVGHTHEANIASSVGTVNKKLSIVSHVDKETGLLKASFKVVKGGTFVPETAYMGCDMAKAIEAYNTVK